MPEWLAALLVGSGGGLIGYLSRGWIDDRFVRAKEALALAQLDVPALRDGLHVFLGQPRAHAAWQENTRAASSAGGLPTPTEKAQLIGTWVYDNAMKYPKERRGSMYPVANVSYQLAKEDRHLLDANPNGYEARAEAWDALDEYGQYLTRALHNLDLPRRAA